MKPKLVIKLNTSRAFKHASFCNLIMGLGFGCNCQLAEPLAYIAELEAENKRLRDIIDVKDEFAMNLKMEHYLESRG